VLVVVKTYKPGIGWECRGCGKLELDAPGPNRCPVCLAARWKEFDVREELARTAEQHRVAVEVVEHNDALMSMGGVGCLLRFLKPGSYLYPAA
jgi:hypothetical protein